MRRLAPYLTVAGLFLIAADRRLLASPPPEVSQGDWEAVAGLLGRAPQGTFEVVVRDAAGGPVVISNSPFLDDGTPMPTLYWLVGRAERDRSAGSSRLAGCGRPKPRSTPPSSRWPMAATRHFVMRPCRPGNRGPRPAGGVGGTRRGVKCLHAHLAWYLAGGPDPVGRWTCEKLGIDPPSIASARAGGPGGRSGIGRGPVAADRLRDQLDASSRRRRRGSSARTADADHPPRTGRRPDGASRGNGDEADHRGSRRSSAR